MKTNIILNIMLATSMAFLGSCTSSRIAQSSEYDDMYFTSADRQKVQHTESASAGTNYSNRSSQSNTAGNDAYYANSSQEAAEQNNQATAETQDAYYDENYDDSRNVPKPSSYTTNNYYGNAISTPQVGWMNSGFGFYNDPFYYDPFFYNPYAIRSSFYSARPGLAFGFGWNSWTGWNTGFGYGYGSGMYDPYWNPYGMYSPMYAYNRGMYGMYDPYWNPWGYNGYMAGYYNGYHDGSIIGGNRVNRTVYAPRSNRSSALAGGRNVVNQGGQITGGRSVNSAPNSGRSLNNDVSSGRAGRAGELSAPNSGRPSRTGELSAPNAGRSAGIERAETRPAREVEIIRPERPSRATGTSNRPSRTPEYYSSPERGSSPERPAIIERSRGVENTNRPSREQYYSRPSRNVAPAREQSPSSAAPSRQSSPMMQQRSAPSRQYSTPSRPSRDYSAPSRSTYSPSSTPSSGGSFSTPSRGGSSAPSGRPSRGGGN
jgi:hypothetical protein